MKLKILNLIFLHKLEVFLVFIEIKHKIDLDATYFKLHLIIHLIKFPTQKFQVNGAVVSLMTCMAFLEVFIYVTRCSSFETKRQFLFSD